MFVNKANHPRDYSTHPRRRLNYQHRAAEAMHDLGQWLSTGKLKYKVDDVESLANAPHALQRLFDGENTGKLMIRV